MNDKVSEQHPLLTKIQKEAYDLFLETNSTPKQLHDHSAKLADRLNEVRLHMSKIPSYLGPEDKEACAITFMQGTSAWFRDLAEVMGKPL